MRYGLSLIMLLVFSNEFHGQNLVHDTIARQLSSAVAEFKNKNKLPSIVVAIVRKTEIVYSEALGHTDLENRVPATLDSKYPIMSVTKTFTATMLMQLVEQGKVNLDDDVKRYVPEYKVQSDFSRTPTTLLQLATHSSGLPRNSPADIDFNRSFDQWMATGGKDSIKSFATNEQILHSLQFIRLEYPPFHYVHHNDRYYSNLGYSVLGIALERAVKTEFSQYISKNIFKPLGMTNSGILNKPAGEQIARGYRYNSFTSTTDRVPPFQINGALYPGGLYSTARDLSKYVIFQFRDDDTLGSQKVLSETSKAMMRYFKIGWKPAFPYALHEGSLPGYRAIVVFNPQTQVGWVILTNGTDVNFNPINNTIGDVVGNIFKEKFPDLKEYVGTYKLPREYGTLQITLKNDSLFSSYLQHLVPGKALVSTGPNRFKVESQNGYAIQYEFVAAENGKITSLKMGQFLWDKVD